MSEQTNRLDYHPPPPKVRWSIGDWVWFIAKNIIGWALMLSAGPIGVLLPGPGGLPLFLIGFGLITFPRKRHMTARVIRGMPVSRESTAYRWFVGVFSILAPAALLSFLTRRWILLSEIREVTTDPAKIREYIWSWSILVAIVYLSCVILLWVFGLRGVDVINLGLRLVAKARRKVRPWLRRHGFDLLPPRRRRRLRRGTAEDHEPDHEILEIHERHQHRLRVVWHASKPWLRRIGGMAVTVLIFFWMFKPVTEHWDDVKGPLSRIDWLRFLLAAILFGAFLFIFRVVSWWRILSGLGHDIPLPPATRIWSTSELARYLPGSIWQVIGRVYLAKPYGVSAPVCSASQILELGVFLLANLIVAIACFLWLGTKINPSLRPLLYTCMAIVPVLVYLLHPNVFYAILNRILRKLGREEQTDRLKKRDLFGLGAWMIVGLLWQSAAIYFLLSEPLGLWPSKWWVVAGAYCLAWSAGFLAFWAPGGLGVREAIFVVALEIALPEKVLSQWQDPEARRVFLAFLGVLLRLWATTGELMLAGLAYAWDYRGAMNQPDAPGRVREPSRIASAPAEPVASVGQSA
jgi:hypothetical protein